MLRPKSCLILSIKRIAVISVILFLTDCNPIRFSLGNSGSEADFIASLKGATGATGATGAAGADGLDGLSAYQVWLSLGNSGSEADFIASLKGEDANNTQIMWSGGCLQHGIKLDSSTIEIPYCLNGLDFNTASSYLEVTDPQNGYITIKKAGFYRINMFAISNILNSYPRIVIENNGSPIHFGHEFTDIGWHDNFADVTWFFNVEDVLRVKFDVQLAAPGAGSYAYHSWSEDGKYGRLQVSFVGE